MLGSCNGLLDYHCACWNRSVCISSTSCSSYRYYHFKPENAVLLVHPWPRDPFSDDPTIAYPPPAKPFKAFGSLPSTSKAEKPLRLDRMHADWGDNRRLSILTEDSEVPQPPQKKSKSQSQSQSSVASCTSAKGTISCGALQGFKSLPKHYKGRSYYCDHLQCCAMIGHQCESSRGSFDRCTLLYEALRGYLEKRTRHCEGFRIDVRGVERCCESC
ncbi:hypothetical protein F5880DRAFT_410865 [Lentinula raphanica]|nr:hypothetical protein F5880DRAFT_410865 [Lentinula raphanica]